MPPTLWALPQSAQLQNNRGMFRPVTIPQWLSDEEKPGIIQAVLISGRDPISIFRLCRLIRAAPDKCVVMEWYLWSEVDESLMNGRSRGVMKRGCGGAPWTVAFSRTDKSGEERFVINVPKWPEVTSRPPLKRGHLHNHSSQRCTQTQHYTIHVSVCGCVATMCLYISFKKETFSKCSHMTS